MIVIIHSDGETAEFRSLKTAAAAVGISLSSLSSKLRGGGGEYLTAINGDPCRVIQQTRPNQSVDASVVAKILDMYDTDLYLYSQIASETGVSLCTVKHLVTKYRKQGAKK